MSEEVQDASSGSPAEGHEGVEGSFNWEDGVTDKALLENPTVANLKGKSMDAILQTHIDAQSHMGTSVKIPEHDATPEDWGTFYDKVRPSDINDYSLEFPESKYTDQATQEWFKSVSHEEGLSQRQADNLNRRHIEHTEKVMLDLDAKAEGIINEKIAANKKELGGNYDKTMNMFERTIKSEGGDQLWDELQSTPLFDNLNFIKLVAKHGDMIGEDNLVVGEGSEGLKGRSLEQVQKDITSIREGDDFKSGFGVKYIESQGRMHNLYKELAEIKRRGG